MEELRSKELERLFKNYEKTLEKYNSGRVNKPWYKAKTELKKHKQSRGDLIKYLGKCDVSIETIKKNVLWYQESKGRLLCYLDRRYNNGKIER